MNELWESGGMQMMGLVEMQYLLTGMGLFQGDLNERSTLSAVR